MYIDGSMQEMRRSIANALMHWSYVYLALTHRYYILKFLGYMRILYEWLVMKYSAMPTFSIHYVISCFS